MKLVCLMTLVCEMLSWCIVCDVSRSALHRFSVVLKVSSKHDIRLQLQQLAAGSVDELSTSVLEENSPKSSEIDADDGGESTPELGNNCLTMLHSK